MNEIAKNIYLEAAADVGDLIRGWTTFQRLIRDEQIVIVLNRSSPRFFGVVQAALRTYVVTLAARLVERAMVAGKKTASLEALIKASKFDDATTADLLGRLHEIRKTAGSVIEYRHRRVVHTDYSIRAEKAEGGMPSLREFDAVAYGLRDFMQVFEQVAGFQPIPYENCGGARDVDEVVRLLSASLPSG